MIAAVGHGQPILHHLYLPKFKLDGTVSLARKSINWKFKNENPPPRGVQIDKFESVYGNDQVSLVPLLIEGCAFQTRPLKTGNQAIGDLSAPI
ncbi:MAG: hypothetical protein AAF998_12100 [Bacteroidota bacterium]